MVLEHYGILTFFALFFSYGILFVCDYQKIIDDNCHFK